MKNSKKLILVIVSIICIVILLVGSIAYYRIVVNGSIKGSTGNAVFVLRDSDNSVWNNKVIDLGKINPGDSGEFTVIMDASGSSVDMYATLEIERTNLPTNLKFYTTNDHKSELHKYYSFLETTNQTETLTIYWYWNPYINDEEDSKFINVSNLEANVRVSAVQISEYAMMKEDRGVSSGFAFWNYDKYIKTITFENNLSSMPSSCTKENLCWDISYDASQKKKVYGYLVDSGLTVSEMDSSTSTTTEKTLYNLYIVSEAPIFAPINCTNLFYGFQRLVQIDFNNNFNTLKVTDMNNMFNRCKSLTSLDLSGFNTSNVTDIHRMFYDCSSLLRLDLSSFDTSNVTNMGYMFSGCSSLSSLDLSSFNASKVTNMNGMFSFCSVLTSLNLSSFNTSKVTNMSEMFYYCSSLISLDLSSFNTSNVIDMSIMFLGCSSLASLDLSNFNTSKVTNMKSMFVSCSSLISLNLSELNTTNVNDMRYMFSGCSKLQTEINIMNANITADNYKNMFNNALTGPEAYVILGYTSDTQTIAEAMRDTCSSETTKARIELKKID